MRNQRRDPQQNSELLRERTLKRVERYYGKLAILQTFELALTGKLGSRAARIAAREDLTLLTKTVRQERSYLEHRATPNSDL